MLLMYGHQIPGRKFLRENARIGCIVNVRIRSFLRVYVHTHNNASFSWGMVRAQVCG